MPSRKPLVLQGGLPKQLAAGDVLDIPARTVPVYLAAGGSRAVKIAAVGTARVITAAGARLEVAHNAASGVWEIGKDTDTSALAARIVAAESSIGGLQTGLSGVQSGVSAKLDANFSGFTDGVSPALTDLIAVRRGANSLKLTVQAWLDWLLSAARTWAGIQSFSAGAALGELSPTMKCRVFDATMPSANSASSNVVAHGLNAANIVSIEGWVYAADDIYCRPNSNYTDSQWGFTWSATHIRAMTPAANGSLIAGRPVRFHIFYKA